jgi:hypothetical protein
VRAIASAISRRTRDVDVTADVTITAVLFPIAAGTNAKQQAARNELPTGLPGGKARIDASLIAGPRRFGFRRMGEGDGCWTRQRPLIHKSNVRSLACLRLPTRQWLLSAT